jgi:hypothetical protein
VGTLVITVLRRPAQCATLNRSADGVTFNPTTISLKPIRDATEYVGTRIRLNAYLDKVRQTVQIDFGIGDGVHAASHVIGENPLAT